MSNGGLIGIKNIPTTEVASGVWDLRNTYLYKLYGIWSGLSNSLELTIANPNAYGTSDGDQFGREVYMHGTYILATSYLEDDASGSIAGVAYLFSKTDGSLLHTFYNPNGYGTSAGDAFGVSVVMSDDYIIISANGEDSVEGDNSGKVYVFSTLDYSLVHTIDNPNNVGTSVGDRFGVRIAVSGNYLIVSAAEEDLGSGTVYIYSITDWSLLHTLTNPNNYGTADSDYFGLGVAAFGDTLVVSAYGEDSSEAFNVGILYIFSLSSGILTHTITSPDNLANIEFGINMRISEDYLVVTARAYSSYSGRVYVFTTSDYSLLYTINNPNAYGSGVGDSFGISISLNDTYLLVGAFAEDPLGDLNSGVLYTFNIESGSLVNTTINPNSYGNAQSDSFGLAAFIAPDNYALVSAPGESSSEGASSGVVYLYKILG